MSFSTLNTTNIVAVCQMWNTAIVLFFLYANLTTAAIDYSRHPCLIHSSTTRWHLKFCWGLMPWFLYFGVLKIWEDAAAVSPSWVCLDLMSFALMLAPTMCEDLRSPTRNIRHNLSSRREMTAFRENTSVSARLFGWEIFTNIQPTWGSWKVELGYRITTKQKNSGNVLKARFPSEI